MDFIQKGKILENFKIMVFIELIIMAVSGVVYIIAKLSGNDCPLIIIPQVMGITFVVILFAIFVVVPFEEWFL